MGIKITKKGLEHIKERLSQPNMDDQAIIRFESMSRSLVYFLQMKEGTIYAEEKEVKEAIAKGRKTGKYHSGKTWIEVFAPEGRVIGGWHRYLLRELPFKANQRQCDLLFRVGQEIIQGKEEGLRL